MNFYCEPWIRFSVLVYKNLDALEEELNEAGGDGAFFLGVIPIMPSPPSLSHPRHYHPCFLISWRHPSPFSSTRHHPLCSYVKMKLTVAALLVSYATVFSTAPVNCALTTLNMEKELELGVTEPLGVFDPLGWLETKPEAFEQRCAVEHKHGRVAMAAIIKIIVRNNHIVFDGYISPSNNLKFSDISTGFACFFTDSSCMTCPDFGLLCSW